ncbi:MAG: hypothetical protein DMF59_02450, partial [Acidobacteria bacterium]
MNRTARVAAALLLLSTISEARVISYSPYTDRASIPAVQNRLNRHFVLFEQTSAGMCCPPILAPPYYLPQGQVVLYDSQGQEEPRVVFPADGTSIGIASITAREEAGVVSILIQTNANFLGANPTNQFLWLMSTDSGASWMKVALPTTGYAMQSFSVDVGGPFARGRYSSVRVGTREVPFVVATAQGVYAITSIGTTNQIFTPTSTAVASLLGSDREGRRFLVSSNNTIYIVDINGNLSTVGARPANAAIEGWISPDGAAFLEETFTQGNVVLFYANGGFINPVAASWEGPPNVQPAINPSWVFFAVP